MRLVTMMISPDAPWMLAMPRTHRQIWLRCKRAIDIVAAGALLLLSTPVLLVALAVVKLTSTGPAIYTQRRIGRHNRDFTIYKVRTMREDAERVGGPRWCVPGDRRITGVGNWLRKLHIDELPQLWNVLRGEMSLVGPRPERPEFMPKIRPFVPGYDQRHAVLPGITGLAQVQVDADTDVGNVARKLKYDLYYIRHQGPMLEAKIYGYTLLKVLGASLPTLRRMMALRLDQEQVMEQGRAA
jgi:lipopolysaccharide/colanic/teichoic acid biosynthesis glycosyltransferase